MIARLALCTLIVAALVCSPARAEESKPDAQGFIHTWLVLAPIPLGSEDAGGEEIDKEQIPSEGKLQPKEGEKTKVANKELKWTAVKTKDSIIDFNEVAGGQNDDSCAYAIAYVVCEKEQTGLTLLIGSNDQAKVYVNGKEVLKFAETRTLDEDSDKAENITLSKGVNTIVFKVINQKNNWQGCMRFKAKDGSVFKDFELRTNP